jgi:hypothetical protein
VQLALTRAEALASLGDIAGASGAFARAEAQLDELVAAPDPHFATRREALRARLAAMSQAGG